MTVTTAAVLRTFAFGDLDARLWGAAWIAGPGRELVVLGAGAGTSLSPASLQGEDESGDWHLSGDGAKLILSAAGGAVAAATPDAGIEGFEQLCRVRGRFVLDGAEQAVDCPGVRGAFSGALDLDRFDSVRRVSAWFEPGEGLALLALRPRNSPGHDSDLITAAVLDPGSGGAVADPRLSTTYTVAGRPARAGLELWLDDDEGAEQQYPRRAAGEAIGVRAESVVGELDVDAELLRCHSHGRAGAGVYFLAQRR